MKKSVLLILFSFFYLIGIAQSQDACYNSYKEALDAYNKKDYTKAQSKFLQVAKDCGDYRDRALGKLEECNKKLAEKQAEQTQKQTADVIKLTGERDDARSQFEDSQSRERNLEKEIEKKRDTIVRLKADTVNLKQTIRQRNDTIESLIAKLENAKQQQAHVTVNDSKRQCQEKLEKAIDQVQILKDSITSMTDEITGLNKSINQLQAKIDSSNKEKESQNATKSDMERLQVTVNQLTEKLNEMSGQVSDIQKNMKRKLKKCGGTPTPSIP